MRLCQGSQGVLVASRGPEVAPPDPDLWPGLRAGIAPQQVDGELRLGQLASRITDATPANASSVRQDNDSRTIEPGSHGATLAADS